MESKPRALVRRNHRSPACGSAVCAFEGAAKAAQLRIGVENFRALPSLPSSTLPHREGLRIAAAEATRTDPASRPQRRNRSRQSSPYDRCIRATVLLRSTEHHVATLLSPSAATRSLATALLSMQPHRRRGSRSRLDALTTPTIAQVIHDYGGICQTIAALAVERGAPITAAEFQTSMGVSMTQSPER